MPTGLNIVLSKKAEKDFEDIIVYIKNNFGSQPSVNFKNLILEFLDLIKDFPEIGSLQSPSKPIRAFVLHRRLKIFYSANNRRIIILRLFDTRQHPKKI